MSETAPAAAQAPANFRLLGVIAFIIGAAAVLMTRLLSLVAPLMISTGLPSAYSLISGMGIFANALSLLLGIAALALGIVVLLRRGAPKGFAAAGAALGGAEVLNALIGFGQAAFYSFI